VLLLTACFAEGFPGAGWHSWPRASVDARLSGTCLVTPDQYGRHARLRALRPDFSRVTVFAGRAADRKLRMLGDV